MARKKTPEPGYNAEGGMLIGYARVSTEGQQLDGQIKALKDYGVLEENIYTDVMSGGKSSRRGLNLALKATREKDTLVVYSLSRIGRSVEYLLKVNRQLLEEGVSLKSLTEPIDTTTAAGKLIFNVQAVFAQFERDVAIERTKMGVAASRAAGVPHGRPPTVTEAQKKQILKLLQTPGISIAAIAKKFNVAAPTIKYHFPRRRTEYLKKR